MKTNVPKRQLSRNGTAHCRGLVEPLECRTMLSAGLHFNITYSSSLRSYPYLSQVKSAVNYVAAEYSKLFSNSMTVNVKIGGDPDPSSLGASSAEFVSDFSYDDVRAALISSAFGRNDRSAIAYNLPPTFTEVNGSGNSLFELARAQAKALGFLAGNDSASDGTISFGTANRYSFDARHRSGLRAGAYDFIGTMEHEFSEIMGRQTELDTGGEFDIFDLFRYSSHGVRDLSGATNDNGDAAGAYFSINNGKTNLVNFNSATGGDIQDWRGDNQDSYDAFGPSNQAQPITAVDIKAMDVIGYTLA